MIFHNTFLIRTQVGMAILRPPVPQPLQSSCCDFHHHHADYQSWKRLKLPQLQQLPPDWGRSKNLYRLKEKEEKNVTFVKKRNLHSVRLHIILKSYCM